jgi:flagellar motor switch protein FliG
MNQATSTDIFLNGKAQIIEMLQIMPPEERKTLLKNIKHKNPTLAIELLESSLEFEDLNNLSTHHMNIVLQYVDAPILGMALKGANQQFQRKVLKLASRKYAEKAYDVLVSNYPGEESGAKKAQQKVIKTAVSLLKRNQIQL